MNKPDVKEFLEKRERVQSFLKRRGFDALIIGTTANFAWATCGGDSHILLDAQQGSCLLVWTSESCRCIANKMDALRIREQELEGLDIEVVSLKWFEPSISDYALIALEGKRILSDIPMPGVECDPQMFYQLHYPLTDGEIIRYREIGRGAEEAVAEVANAVQPGMTGIQIQNALLGSFAQRNLSISCMIIGLDGDISRYRHPLPRDNRLEKALMLVMSGKRYGLNVPITRMVYFGEVPEDIQKRYEAACTIEAHSIRSCVAGAKFHDISMMQKELYKKFGYEKEWEEHFVGGLTGYIANDASFCVDPDARLVDRQTFNWYVTITGVNVEETMIAKEGAQELFTVTGLWPVKTFSALGGEIALPQILKN